MKNHIEIEVPMPKLHSHAVLVAVERKLQVCVIMTSFNRRQITLDCLNALAANTRPELFQVSVVLVDDGSTDGTAEAVRASSPWVQLVIGDGNLFWCRGMNKAFGIAMQSDYDYYLWLNDDTILRPDALSRLLECESNLHRKHGRPVIVVGSTVDAQTGSVTYGGKVQASRIRSTRFLQIMPSSAPQRCDSMTGNIVLIPRDVAQIVGNLDAVFEHAMGDVDYALRARQLGVDVWVGPGVFGVCRDNIRTGTYLDASLPLSRRWKLMLSRKGLPWRSWLVLTRRHMGPLWPLYFCWPYIRLVLGAGISIRSLEGFFKLHAVEQQNGIDETHPSKEK